MMRIFVYSHMFPPSQGGLQYSNLEICMGLKELGHEILVMACENPGIRPFIRNLSFPVEILPKWPNAPMTSLGRRGIANWLFLFSYFFRFRSAINRFRPDIILVTDETGNAFWGLMSLGFRLSHVSYVSVPVFLGKPRFFKGLTSIGLRKTIYEIPRFFALASYRKSRSIAFVSHSTQDIVLEYLPDASSKSSVIPRSVDDIFFSPYVDFEKLKAIRSDLGIKSSDFVLLSVSRLSARKGLDDALIVLADLIHSDYRNLKYLIVGDGRDLTRLKEITTERHLADHVRFLGNIDHSRLLEYYDLCDLFVLPSRRGADESFGRVFVEAAARGKASIAVDEGGMSDVVKDGETGFLIDSGNRVMLKERIIFFINNNEISRRMGLQAKEHAEKNFKRSCVSKTLETMLMRSLG